MPLGSAIGAVGSIIAGDRVSSSSAKSARETNEFNRENYKHRYQWQVKDMRKAGLNPALSYTTGAGTPTGGVQQADFGGSQYNEASQQVGSMMSKLSSQMLQREQVNNAKNMNEQIQAQTDQIKSQTNIANMKVIDEILNLNSQTAKNYSDAHYGNPLKLGGNIGAEIVDALKDVEIVNPVKKVLESIDQSLTNSAKPVRNFVKEGYNKVKGKIKKWRNYGY